jgi:hypothetical protein
MSENNIETKNYKKPLFNHTKENYQIMEQVIKQSKEAGFDEWQCQEDQTLKELAEYLLFFGPFIEEIFYHDFATRFFQCKEYTGYLKHLQEMVVFKNPFEYLKNFT